MNFYNKLIPRANLNLHIQPFVSKVMGNLKYHYRRNIPIVYLGNLQLYVCQNIPIFHVLAFT